MLCNPYVKFCILVQFTLGFSVYGIVLAFIPFDLNVASYQMLTFLAERKVTDQVYLVLVCCHRIAEVLCDLFQNFVFGVG